MYARRQYVNKAFTVIAAREHCMEINVGFFQMGVQGRMYAPDNRQQVRDKYQLYLPMRQGIQALLYLRQVAMTVGGISGKGFPRFAELCSQ